MAAPSGSRARLEEAHASMAAVCFSPDLVECVLERLSPPCLLNAAPTCKLWSHAVLRLDDSTAWREYCEMHSPLLSEMRAQTGTTWRTVLSRWRSLCNPALAPLQPKQLSIGIEMRLRESGTLVYAAMGDLSACLDHDVVGHVAAAPSVWPLAAWVRESGAAARDYENVIELTCFLLRKSDGKLLNMAPSPQLVGEDGARFMWSMLLVPISNPHSEFNNCTLNFVASCALPDGSVCEEDEIYDEAALTDSSLRGSSILGGRLELHASGAARDFLVHCLNERIPDSRWV